MRETLKKNQFPNLTVQFIMSLSTLMRTVPCLDDEREGEGGKWVKVVCKRRGEKGRRRRVWLNFGKREAAACIRRRPTWEQWRIKQAIKKEEKEGRVGGRRNKEDHYYGEE